VTTTIAQAYVQILPTTKGIAGNISKEFDGVGDAAGNAMGGGIMGTLKRFAGPIAAVVSVGALVKLGKDLTLAGEVAKTSNARIEQIASSMDLFGDNVGDVTDRLIANAEATALQTGIDQNSIKATQAKLLTFGNLAASADEVGGAFDRALAAAIDLEAAGFGAAEQQAVALGKALNDPTKGLAALGRSGITFTEIEKEKIKALQESGDLLGAQEILLEAVEKQVGGTAEATADMSAQFQVAGSQVKERFGKSLSDAFDRIGGPALDRFLPKILEMADSFGPLVEQVVDFFLAMLDGEGSMSPIIALFQEILGNLPELLPMFQEIGAVVQEIVAVAFEIFMDIARILITDVLPVFMESFQMLAPIVMELTKTILELIRPLLTALAPILPVLANLVIALIVAFTPLLEAVLPILIGLIEFLTPILITVGEIIGLVLVAAIEIFTGAIEGMSAFIADFSQFFEDTFTAIRDFFFTIINGLIGGFESFANGAIGAVNAVIRALNSISFKFPDWFPPPFRGQSFSLGLKTIPLISLPRLAKGGTLLSSGSVMVGEEGPEILSLPRGAQVTPLDKTGSVINYYAAENKSLDSEQELRLAMQRARVLA
jgi:hypothetical protein